MIAKNLRNPPAAWNAVPGGELPVDSAHWRGTGETLGRHWGDERKKLFTIIP